MAGPRQQRVAEAIRAEVSRLLQSAIKDPRIGFVSIVKVEVTSDLRYAKVYASVYGDEATKKSTLNGLESATGFMRSAIANRLKLRHAPEVRFLLDESIEYGARIAELLGKAHGEADPAPDAINTQGGREADQHE